MRTNLADGGRAHKATGRRSLAKRVQVMPDERRYGVIVYGAQVVGFQDSGTKVGTVGSVHRGREEVIKLQGCFAISSSHPWLRASTRVDIECPA